jgi:subtilisin
MDYPAAYAADFPHVIAVGAVDRKSTAADFSSAGHQMTVAAPGIDILSTMPNYHVRATSEGFHTHYDLMSGTSMAAPFVSALATLIRAKFPDLTAGEVRAKIEETAVRLPNEDPNRVGNGLINAADALV